MIDLLSLLDYLTSALIVLSIFLIEKYRKAWLLYSFSSVLFVIVCMAKGLPGLTIMGCVLAVLGLRNYRLKGKHCCMKRRRGTSLRTKPRDRFEQWLDLHNHKCELVRTVGSVLSGVGGTLAILRLLGII